VSSTEGAAAKAGARVLIVDDDEGHAEALADGLEIDGYQCVLAHSGGAALERLAEASFDAVLTDLKMHDKSGLDVLRESRVLQPDAAVLLITGHGSLETAVEAMRMGAADYLQKPVMIAELRTRLARSLEARDLRRDNLALRKQLDERFGLKGLVGASPQMERVFKIVRQVADTNATVLLLGESGTGKELVARAVHANSPRRERRFVAVNCAALSEGLIESELFGHMKGAFTGAIAAKDGQIVHADGGTLFLDELGDMPLMTQAKLLRVLETREVTPVGGTTPRKVDLRLVGATHRDLRAMVREGTFREDLLFRLQVVVIELPPLRERTGDLPLLIDHFVAEFARTHGRPVRSVAPEARAALMRYAWPGNVRELRNVLESMVLLCGAETLTAADVPDSIREAAREPRRGGYELAGRTLEEVERDLIEATLQLTGGNREKAAKLMGIGERTLYRRIKHYQME
jgi:two-component system response regulator HydG